MAQVSINPSVLAWALQDSALGAGDLSDVTGRSLADVQSWLTGQSRPQTGDLKQIAKRLGRSTHFFYLPSPPQQNPAVARFRSRLKTSLNQKLSTAETTNLRSAQHIQKIAITASEELPKVHLPPPQMSATQYAFIVRDWLHWSVAEQIKATSKSAAFRAVRSRIEASGVIVLLRAMGEDECRGFSLPHEQIPLIAVNASFKFASIRLFTLLHEFAHIARGRERMCHDDNSTEEKWCDEFAAALLLPTNSLKDYLLNTRKKHWLTINDTNDLRLTSDRYKVSWLALAIRLKQLGFADQSLIDDIRASSGEIITGFAPGSSRTAPQIRLDEYGTTYSRIIVSAVSRETIPALEGRRLLNVNGANYRVIADQVRRDVNG